MCRVPAGKLPVGGHYTPPTWLDALAPAATTTNGASAASASAASASAAAAAAATDLSVPLPAISFEELSMLDSLLNVKVEGAASTQQQQQQQQQQPAAMTKKFVVAPAPPPPPPVQASQPPAAFLSGVFPSSGLAAFGVTHANAAAFSAAAMLENRGKRAKKSAEEIEAQIERVKKRRRESAQRSRARKSLFVKSLEVENRELRRELFRLRAVVEAAVAGGHSLHPSALVPPPSFAAAAGGVAAAGAAYFAGEREREDEEEDEGGDDEEGQEESCRDECGASNAAFSSRSNGNLSAGSPISTDC